MKLERSPVCTGPGVYILYNGEEITYVGKSMNVLVRLASHASKGRAFTAYSVIPCLPDDLDAVETELINRLKPPQNKTHRAFRPSLNPSS